MRISCNSSIGSVGNGFSYGKSRVLTLTVFLKKESRLSLRNVGNHMCCCSRIATLVRKVLRNVKIPNIVFKLKIWRTIFRNNGGNIII